MLWRKMHDTREMKKPLSKGINKTQKLFCELKKGNFKANNKNTLQFMLEKCKNGLPATRETTGSHHISAVSMARFQSQ
jgi:hypothetical protein